MGTVTDFMTATARWSRQRIWAFMVVAIIGMVVAVDLNAWLPDRYQGHQTLISVASRIVAPAQLSSANFESYIEYGGASNSQVMQLPSPVTPQCSELVITIAQLRFGVVA